MTDGHAYDCAACPVAKGLREGVAMRDQEITNLKVDLLTAEHIGTIRRRELELTVERLEAQLRRFTQNEDAA